MFGNSDADRARLRVVIAAVERELWLLPRSAMDGGVAVTARLHESWQELVGLLALGPQAEVRECPICKHFGMRTATRCGYCWTKLAPLAPEASDGPGTSAIP